MKFGLICGTCPVSLTRAASPTTRRSLHLLLAWPRRASSPAVVVAQRACAPAAKRHLATFLEACLPRISCLPAVAFTDRGFHRWAAQVTAEQLEKAQIEIARAAVRRFQLSADVLAFDTTNFDTHIAAVDQRLPTPPVARKVVVEPDPTPTAMRFCSAVRPRPARMYSFFHLGMLTRSCQQKSPPDRPRKPLGLDP